MLHVSSVEASLRFYVDRLGFTVAWRYEEDGRARVAQVDRQSCALILSDQWAEKVGKETHEAAVAALDALRAELEARGVQVKDGLWGYRLQACPSDDGLFSSTEVPQGEDLEVAQSRESRCSLGDDRSNAAKCDLAVATMASHPRVQTSTVQPRFRAFRSKP